MSLFNIFRCNDDLSRLEKQMKILPAMAKKLEKLPDLSRALAMLPKLAENLESLQSLHEKFEKLEEKVMAIEENLALFQQSTEKQIKEGVKQVALEETIASVSEELKGVKRQIDGTMGVIEALPEEKREIFEKIETLDNALAEFGSKISEDVKSTRESISGELCEKYKQASTRDERMAEKIANRLDKLDEIAPKIEERLISERSFLKEAFERQSCNAEKLLSLIAQNGKHLESQAKENIAQQLQNSQSAERIVAATEKINAKIAAFTAGHTSELESLQNHQEAIARAIVDLPIDSISHEIEQLREKQEQQQEYYTPLLQQLDERLIEVMSAIDDNVAKEVNRLGKTIFKLTNSAEASRVNFEQAMANFEQEKKRCQQENEKIKEKSEEKARKSELQLAQDLFLLMDALDAGIETGEELLHVGSLRQRLGFFSKTVAGVPKEAVDSWLTGIKMMRKRTVNILKSVEVEPIESLEKTFDPEIHRAVGAEKGSDGIVIKEITRGYKARERVLRYAEVIVGKEE